MTIDLKFGNWVAAVLAAVTLGVIGLALGTFVTTWLVMLGWGAAFNNGIADQAPGYWDLYFPVLCIGAALAGVTWTPKSS